MFKKFVSAFLLTLGLAHVAHANLVTNGGFETGDYTSWTTTVTGDPWLDVCGSPARPCTAFGGLYSTVAHSGQYAGVNGLLVEGGISQDLSTVAGQTYEVSFWLANCADIAALGGCPDNNFRATWDGAEVFSLVDAPSFGWTRYAFTVQATDASTTFALLGTNNSAFFLFDDVDVHATTRPNPNDGTVPEPASLALVALGMVGLGASRRRRA